MEGLCKEPDTLLLYDRAKLNNARSTGRLYDLGIWEEGLPRGPGPSPGKGRIFN